MCSRSCLLASQASLTHADKQLVKVPLLPLTFSLLLCAQQMGCCLLCAQAQQLRHEVEQVTGEKAQAEQQVGELRAVQGQLELEVARLQHQLQGLEGQLQVLTKLQSECALSNMQLMCSYYLFGQSIDFVYHAAVWRASYALHCVLPMKSMNQSVSTPDCCAMKSCKVDGSMLVARCYE